MDLAGDGQPDLVVLDGPMPGLYEHDDAEGWQPFRSFNAQLNRNIQDPNLKFVDLDGDGHADILITEDDAFTWHASLAEEGFGPASRVVQALDEEKGPRLVFADGTQSIYLADMSGDGLTDLVRIRNGEVCYWPNLGYCRFGAKVTMDFSNSTDLSSYFDNPEQFDHKRIRLADIDGSGTTDIIYLHRNGVRLYFNQSGNSWSAPYLLNVFPRVDDVASIVPVDLLGNGTACLVWSSPLLGDAHQPMRYVNLMSGHKSDLEAQQQERLVQKPHLLVTVKNNLGAETRVHYAPSTKFYLQDKREGKPWITRLPFPVHVVERVETYDRVSRNRFVTCYAYHHGYFDGEEREFRGFGIVEQWDTEEIGTISEEQNSSLATNLDSTSFVPPIHTRTWFHTGAYQEAGKISHHLAREYYGAPQESDVDFDQKWRDFEVTLLPDTILPSELTPNEEREACRSLKGAMLRQEVYADDAPIGAPQEIVERANTPYTVTEQNFTIETVQPQSSNRNAVFFTHSREALSYHYERNPEDPRIGHVMTLEVDNYGNVLKSVAIAYGRKQSSLAEQFDRDKQTKPLITYTENSVTNAIDDSAHPDDYRTPLPSEARTYELHADPDTDGYKPSGVNGFFQSKDFVKNVDGKLQLISSGEHEVAYESSLTKDMTRRLIEDIRTLYRKDDLTELLNLGELEPLALPGESYKLAFTPGLLSLVYLRNNQPLLPPSPSDVLAGGGEDQGGYVDLDGDGYWWIPSGQIFYSLKSKDMPAQELAHAQNHFFLPHRYRDPFGQDSFVSYDSDETNPQKNYNLLAVKTEDAVGNTVTTVNDYRVMQPIKITDPNGNRSEVQFDALGMVVGTAVMGKENELVEGDSFATFNADLTLQEIKDYLDTEDPRPLAIAHLGTATTRIIYDLDRVPSCAATTARETHVSDLNGQQTKVQFSFSYSDGFGREIQKKIQAEPGPVPKRDPDTGLIILDSNGQPVMKPEHDNSRWVGSGWTIFNNKGKPVRQYEPFFTDTHRFEFDVRIGVSPVLFYDPLERVVATLHPNHTWEKVVFDPWHQKTYDVNDTIAGVPIIDNDISGFVKEYFATQPSTWQTWFEERIAGALGVEEQKAAQKTQVHADTPTVAHFDTLGRPFLTIAHNRFQR
ncbi:MAG TPA: toxin TcdB middle/N-terminal domain-containing protein, partial [Anaerolineales bacterium]|nr:toxin TcdB middle/N-terminal domain-containing protein [Anaerolineales bacterium]